MFMEPWGFVAAHLIAVQAVEARDAAEREMMLKMDPGARVEYLKIRDEQRQRELRLREVEALEKIARAVGRASWRSW